MAIRPTARYAAKTSTRRVRPAASGPIAPRSCTPSVAARPTRTCPSSWAASKAPCAASRITTIGRTRYAAPSWSMPNAICCFTAMPSAPSSRSHTAWRRASRWRASPMCAAPPSCGARMTRPLPTGSNSTPAKSTCLAAWTATSTPIKRPPSRRRNKAAFVPRMMPGKTLRPSPSRCIASLRLKANSRCRRASAPCCACPRMNR